MTTTEKRGFRLPWGTENRKPEDDLDEALAQPLTAATDLAPAIASGRAAGEAASTLRRGQLDDLGAGPFGLAAAPLPGDPRADAAGTLVDVRDPAPPKAEVPAPKVEPADTTAHAVEAPIADAFAWPDVDRRGSAAHLASDAPPPPRPVVADPNATARRSNPLVAGLVKAMRDAARTARDETTARMRADATARLEEIKSEALVAGAALKKQADEDITGIREWSKAELARVRQETETRIADRRTKLVREAEDHATQIEQLTADVKSAVAEFEGEMERFFEVLLAEDDPARLAAFAERLPEVPGFARATGTAPTGRPGSKARSTTSRPGGPRRPADPGKRRERAAARLTPDVAAAAEAEAIAGLDDLAASADPSQASAAEPESPAAETDSPVAETESPAAETESPAAAAEATTVADAVRAEVGAVATLAPAEAERDTDGHAAVGVEVRDDAEALDAWTVALAAIRAKADEAPAAIPDDEPAAAADELLNDADDAPAGSLASVLATAPRIDSPDDLSPEERIALLGFDEPAPEDAPAPIDTPARPPLEDVTRVVATGLTSVAGISAFKSAIAAVPGVVSVNVTTGHDAAFVFSVVHAGKTDLRTAVTGFARFEAELTGDEGGVLDFAVSEPAT